MKVGELKEILAAYPDDMEVHVVVDHGEAEYKVEARDIMDRDHVFKKTILQVRHWNYGSPQGYAHLTDEEMAKRRAEVLDGLADIHRPWKHATRQFTDINQQFRIYYSGSNPNEDWKYGTVYDPRVFAALEDDGLIALSPGRWGGKHAEITIKGLATLKDFDSEGRFKLAS